MKDSMRKIIYRFTGGFLGCILWASIAFGQTISIQGIVTDNQTGSALQGANVAFLELNGEGIKGNATDGNGFYQVNGLLPGEYVFRVSYIGYRVHTDTLMVGDLRTQTLSVSLTPQDGELDELVVSQPGRSVLEGGRQRVTAEDMARVPASAGSGDLASYIQTLPGVISSGDRGGQLYIRGGTPAENLVLMDGMLIFNPFHIVGFYSAFPEGLVSSVDMYAGGFGAKYNGRISSVMDVQMRDGNRDRYRGSGTLSPFLGEVIVEGPIKKGRSSVIASLRNSILEHTGPAFIGGEHPLTFNSQYVRVSHGERNSRCSLTAMRTYDRGRLNVNENADLFRWGNFLTGGRCVVLPSDSQSLFDFTMGVSHVYNHAGNSINPDREASATRMQIKVNVTRPFLGQRLDFGLFTNMNWQSYDFREQFQIPRSDSEIMLGLGGHIEPTIQFNDRFEIKPGAVLAVYPGIYKASLEPRFRASWKPLGRNSESLHLALGLYRQSVAGISDNRDAGSAFTAWMQVPNGQPQMEAVHALLGWQQSLGEQFELSIEGYAKKLRHIPVAVWSNLTSFSTELTSAKGNVAGGDIRLEWQRRNVYAFVGYGISWTEYESEDEYFNLWFDEEIRSYHPPHDRRHQVNSLVSVEAGAFEFSVAWQFGTGLPFTRPMGFDDFIRFDRGLPDIRENYGNPRVILDRPYSARVPVYHRLDFSVERSFQLNLGEITMSVGAINAYDQQNLFYYDVYTQNRIDQLPFAPYFSVKLDT